MLSAGYGWSPGGALHVAEGVADAESGQAVQGESQTGTGKSETGTG